MWSGIRPDPASPCKLFGLAFGHYNPTQSLFLEQVVECGAGVVRVARPRTVRSRWRAGRRAVARHRYSRLEQRAVVGFVLNRNSGGDGLHTLKSRRRLEADALFTTVKIGAALGALAFEIGVGSELGRAGVAA